MEELYPDFTKVHRAVDTHRRSRYRGLPPPRRKGVAESENDGEVLQRRLIKQSFDSLQTLRDTNSDWKGSKGGLAAAAQRCTKARFPIKSEFRCNPNASETYSWYFRNLYDYNTRRAHAVTKRKTDDASQPDGWHTSQFHASALRKHDAANRKPTEKTWAI